MGKTTGHGIFNKVFEPWLPSWRGGVLQATELKLKNKRIRGGS